MTSDPLFLVTAAVILIVLIILMAGLGTFIKGGEFNRKYANRIMRWRVGAQAVAILMILIYVLVRRGG
jgi:hypothetical protein